MELGGLSGNKATDVKGRAGFKSKVASAAQGQDGTGWDRTVEQLTGNLLKLAQFLWELHATPRMMRLSQVGGLNRLTAVSNKGCTLLEGAASADKHFRAARQQAQSSTGCSGRMDHGARGAGPWTVLLL